VERPDETPETALLTDYPADFPIFLDPSQMLEAALEVVSIADCPTFLAP
jgi:hypothetical protein